MRRPFSPLREGCGTAAAWLAAAAMVLQLFLAAPMQLLAPVLAVPVCSVTTAGADAGLPRVPLQAHRHDDCLLCQGSGIPLLAVATASVPVVRVAYLRPAPVAAEPVPLDPRFDGYAARAPPNAA